MRPQLTPYYVELVQEACVRSFWRKKALSRILRYCGVPEALVETWRPNETKRDFLTRLFLELPSSERGRQILDGVAEFLARQRVFPDLEKSDDTAALVDAAQEAVLRLRLWREQQDEEAQTENERRLAEAVFQARQAEVARTQQGLREFAGCLHQLVRRAAEPGAGREFEKWFHDLLDFSRVANRRSGAALGREDAGTAVFAGSEFLVETRFSAAPTDTSAIGGLFGKVSEMSDGARALLVSVSGYTERARKAASSASTPLLLLDHSHLCLVLSGAQGMRDVLERLQRHAEKTGEAYLAAERFSGIRAP
jgi:hypothetical protein